MKLSVGRGLKLAEIAPNGAAEAAGLNVGDVLLSIDGVDVEDDEEVKKLIRARAVGSKLRLCVLRAGSELSVIATLGGDILHEWTPRLLGRTEGREVSWFARHHAITILPAVSSLKALRRIARPSGATRPMIGFGNPLLLGPDDRYAGRAQQAVDRQRCGLRQRIASWFGWPRGVMPLETRGGLAQVEQLRKLAPLPETADELCDVARYVDADVAEIHLGSEARERFVKALSSSGQLAQYRIVHFATHGAIAGEFKGYSEPGLVLTPPDKASEDDDGYLSASEVAALKLDADWVVLSACNTAAGDSNNAQALSGLARAFFYAGARALLVTHWAVDSDVTVKLVTGALREASRDVKVGRAEALRRSMLALIDKEDGKQSHPAFWAPFILVGEGAR